LGCCENSSSSNNNFFRGLVPCLKQNSTSSVVGSASDIIIAGTEPFLHNAIPDYDAALEC
jgi:hypothetical protein